MQLHRPKALDDLNVDFFSGDIDNTEEKIQKETGDILNRFTDEIDIDFSKYTEDVSNVTEPIESERRIPQLPNKDASEPYSKEEIMDFLSEDFSKLDEIIENIPFTGISDEGNEEKVEFRHEVVSEEHKEEPVERKPLVDEKTALESFPDLSDSIIDLAAKPIHTNNEKQREKDAIKQAKDNAKNSIENEKKRIKEQKKLEKTVQRPFGKRRAAVFLLVIFLILGIFASAVAALAYAVDKSDEGYVKMSGITAAYVDGDKISGDKHIGEYIFVKQGRIQGNDTLMFLGAGNTLNVADVIGFGDGLYAVEMGSTVYRVDSSNILGCAKFKTPNLAIIRNIISGYSFMVFGGLAIYFVLVIFLSSMRLRKLNAAINEIKESYELI